MHDLSGKLPDGYESGLIGEVNVARLYPFSPDAGAATVRFCLLVLFEGKQGK